MEINTEDNNSIIYDNIIKHKINMVFLNKLMEKE